MSIDFGRCAGANQGSEQIEDGRETDDDACFEEERCGLCPATVAGIDVNKLLSRVFVLIEWGSQCLVVNMMSQFLFIETQESPDSSRLLIF